MKIYLVPLLCLALILCVLELCSKQIKPGNGLVQITDGKQTVHLQVQSLQKQMTRKVKTRRGSEWAGVYLSKVLADNGYDLKKYRKCILTARDGMSVEIPFDEVTDEQALLTYMKEKKTGKKELKLIMLQDPFEQRWLKYINQITLE